jgi:hypothetical protein
MMLMNTIYGQVANGDRCITSIASSTDPLIFPFQQLAGMARCTVVPLHFRDLERVLKAMGKAWPKAHFWQGTQLRA